MRTKTVCVAAALSLLLAGPTPGQKIPTGTLTGHVTDGTAPLPGVTITLTSPNLQGARTSFSTINGDYILELLPAGPYAVMFELDGFQTVETSVKISGDLTSRVDAAMPQITTVAEAVTVAGRYETLSAMAAASTTHEAKLVQLLPVSRDALAYLDLSPTSVQLTSVQLSAGHPYQQLAGAVSSESLYLLNGAPNMDGVTGKFLALYIEDAIQETTTSLSNVSAEYGRFTGGVMSVLTKSGGNEFHGSLRLNLTNPKWTAPTPLTDERADTLGKVWEGTLGGYLFKDRLWFFLGGRTTSQATSLQTFPPVSVPFDQTERENRYEGKLTLSLSTSHRIVGSYLDVQDEVTNWTQIPVYDLASLANQSIPMEIEVLNYNGVLSNTVFVEAQGSYRKKQWVGGGSRYSDIERGTPILDSSVWVPYNSPWYCAVCGGTSDTRENSDAFLKASWFLSTATAGSHDLRVGADLFDDMRQADNWQTGSGYALDAVPVNIVGSGTSATFYPVFLPDYSVIEYYPVYELSKGDHFKTKSAFVHDAWHLNGHFTFNVGVRYDKNDGTDESGTKVVKDSKWSPRLSVAWDPKGDGATQVVLGYGQYVAGINNYVADKQTKAGSEAAFWYLYEGPPINADGNEVDTHEAVRRVFDWISSIGGLPANPQLLVYASVPGYQVFIGDNLRSPSTTAWTIGVSRRLGARGLVRFDYLDKTWTDLNSARVDMTTGHSKDPVGNVYDRIIIENDPHVLRRYQAVVLQSDYRVGERLRIGGNYTLARLYGTDTGYAGPGPNQLDYYPEYRDLKWYAPAAYLGGDHRHKLNFYASWDAVSTAATALNVAVLQRVLSGSPYGAAAYSTVRVGPYVTNPGYATPPVFSTYWFTAPDACRMGTISSTDIAATLSFKLGKGFEVYLNPQIRNVLNRQAAINVDTTVYTNYNLPDTLALFNPFKDTPKECPQGTTCNPADGYNWQKGPGFGKAVQPTDYQTPRRFLVNVGLRF